MKKYFLMIGILGLIMVGCHKEEEENNNTTPQDTTQTTVQKHNVELRYDGRTNAGCVHIAMDTIRKYNADKYVDTIFMIPEPYYQFETWDLRNLQSVVNNLRERHNVNPNKVFGKGDLKLNYYAVDQNPEIVRFFADTLKYNVVYQIIP